MLAPRRFENDADTHLREPPRVTNGVQTTLFITTHRRQCDATIFIVNTSALSYARLYSPMPKRDMAWSSASPGRQRSFAGVSSSAGRAGALLETSLIIVGEDGGWRWE